MLNNIGNTKMKAKKKSSESYLRELLHYYCVITLDIAKQTYFASGTGWRVYRNVNKHYLVEFYLKLIEETKMTLNVLLIFR